MPHLKLSKNHVIANQSADWCGNPYSFWHSDDAISKKGERIATSGFALLAMTYFFRSRRGRRPRRPGGMQIFLAALWKTGKRGVGDAAPYDAAIFSFC